MGESSEPEPVPELDPLSSSALFRGLTQRRISRRDLMRYSGIGAVAAGAAALLAACGVAATGSSSAPSSSPTFRWSRQKLHHVLDFANWPYYIDTHRGSTRAWISSRRRPASR